MKTQCPKCYAQYNVPETYEGKKTKCLKCNESFIIMGKSIACDNCVLNPDSTFPLTISGIDKNTALKLKDILDQTKTVHASGLFDSVAEIVAQSGLRCKEIEDYVAKYREKFDLGGEEQPVDEYLDVIPYCNLNSLFNGKQIDPVIGNNLIASYGIENLLFYCRHFKMIDIPRPIPINHRDRKRFDELVRVKLATMGGMISKSGKSGESFKLNSLENSINLHDLSSWLERCQTIAELITITYAHAYFATQRILNNTNSAIAEILKGYEVATVGDDCTCPFCSQMDGKKYSAESPPKIPFHIGCRCTLLEIFD